MPLERILINDALKMAQKCTIKTSALKKEVLKNSIVDFWMPYRHEGKTRSVWGRPNIHVSQS